VKEKHKKKWKKKDSRSLDHSSGYLAVVTGEKAGLRGDKARKKALQIVLNILGSSLKAKWGQEGPKERLGTRREEFENQALGRRERKGRTPTKKRISRNRASPTKKPMARQR